MKPKTLIQIFLKSNLKFKLNPLKKNCKQSAAQQVYCSNKNMGKLCDCSLKIISIIILLVVVVLQYDIHSTV